MEYLRTSQDGGLSFAEGQAGSTDIWSGVWGDVALGLRLRTERLALSPLKALNRSAGSLSSFLQAGDTVMRFRNAKYCRSLAFLTIP
jgi:hypothetical protein